MTARLASLAAAHPWVRSAHWDPNREAIIVHPADSALAVRPAPGPLLSEHLEHWRHVYSYVYAAAEQRYGDDLDLSGWRASDTGAPFDRAHMLEWIDHAVRLVLRGDPATVLEVGCGSGLLAHRIHPRTRGYVGLDPAEPAVERLRAQALPGVRVVHAAAHELTTAPVVEALRSVGATAPDRIVFNSVTQCFPDSAYLTAVLEDALDVVAPGGAVVVGDVRNLASAAAFAHWIEAARNPESTAADLARQAAARLAAEEELLCDPRFFARLADKHGRAVRVACHAKPIGADTELTRYRYDVVMTVDGPAPATTRTVMWDHLPGSASGTWPTALATALRDPAVLVTGIPNALLDTQNPAAVTPAQLVTVIPPDAAVLLDSADARVLAAGRPEQHAGVEAVDDSGAVELCTDPLARFVRLRLPEVLADHLEQQSPNASVPAIVVAEESVTR
ncbi:methyltransferase domain-containing protein [Nocardia sp. BSTN01]|uniref:class I SAM-dependent methyltransferase n=1 Tax=Nocardia sp. BSTN01 TaxID=2783665 RepID=UPI00188DE631|nr:class I SAM-dependent methyltransferase [Nocardia sp. BSTN01]MBF5000668.1 methyltransferase domain-containing protein [Nocardia sp. BSTN01]